MRTSRVLLTSATLFFLSAKIAARSFHLWTCTRCKQTRQSAVGTSCEVTIQTETFYSCT